MLTFGVVATAIAIGSSISSVARAAPIPVVSDAAQQRGAVIVSKAVESTQSSGSEMAAQHYKRSPTRTSWIDGATEAVTDSGDVAAITGPSTVSFAKSLELPDTAMKRLDAPLDLLRASGIRGNEPRSSQHLVDLHLSSSPKTSLLLKQPVKIERKGRFVSFTDKDFLKNVRSSAGSPSGPVGARTEAPKAPDAVAQSSGSSMQRRKSISNSQARMSPGLKLELERQRTAKAVAQPQTSDVLREQKVQSLPTAKHLPSSKKRLSSALRDFARRLGRGREPAKLPVIQAKLALIRSGTFKSPLGKTRDIPDQVAKEGSDSKDLGDVKSSEALTTPEEPSSDSALGGKQQE